MNATRELLAALAMAALAAALVGCVTINVYFPAAAAEKAADRIIDEVYRLDGTKGATGDKPAAQ